MAIIQLDLKIDSKGAFVSFDLQKDLLKWTSQLTKGVNALNHYNSMGHVSNSNPSPEEIDDRLKSDFDTETEPELPD